MQMLGGRKVKKMQNNDFATFTCPTYCGGLTQYKYADIKAYEVSLDVNGNPTYAITMKEGGFFHLSGSLAYEFDRTQLPF